MTVNSENRPQRGMIQTPDGEIEYREIGKGKPLLLLHGLPQSSRQYDQHMWRVAQNRRVIAMTMMGCGQSARPSTPYTEMNQYAETMLWFLDSLGIDKTDIFATHTGSALAMSFAALYSNKINKLIIQEPFHYANLEGGKERLFKAHNYYPVKNNGSHLLDIWKKNGGSDPDANLNRVMDKVIDHLILDSRENVEDIYADFGWEGAIPFCMLKYNFFEEIKKITVPTLIVHGSESALGVQHNDFVNGIPNGEGIRPKSPSLMNLEKNPTQWAEIINNYIN
ncbi:MAG: Pimeloyl-ACP methyl ester carboxylesterase [Chloroflexi bacterium]|jgi:pimeloyl-ACP methyl ester carboxylesterase|nr:MAG: Pimeloyl-ACP methyl ester carboxylesterase [Chloroflexota bacterium]|tara:strand:- start:374 stop:1213 length:840 start_codon:yes stop_codon:yes gene_type:complete